MKRTKSSKAQSTPSDSKNVSSEIWAWLKTISVETGDNEFIGQYVKVKQSDLDSIELYLLSKNVFVDEVDLYNEGQETSDDFINEYLVYSLTSVKCWPDIFNKESRIE